MISTSFFGPIKNGGSVENACGPKLLLLMVMGRSQDDEGTFALKVYLIIYSLTRS